MGLLKQFHYDEPAEEVIETREILAPVSIIEPEPEKEFTLADLEIKRDTQGVIKTIETVKNGKFVKMEFKRDNAGRLHKILVED